MSTCTVGASAANVGDPAVMVALVELAAGLLDGDADGAPGGVGQRGAEGGLGGHGDVALEGRDPAADGVDGRHGLAQAVDHGLEGGVADGHGLRRQRDAGLGVGGAEGGLARLDACRGPAAQTRWLKRTWVPLTRSTRPSPFASVK